MSAPFRVTGPLALAATFACGPGSGGPLVSQDCGGEEAIRIADVPADPNWVAMLGDRLSFWHYIDSPARLEEAYLVDPCGAQPAQRYARTATWPEGDGWVSCAERAIQWTTDVDVAPTSLAVAAKDCELTVTERGLFVVDESTRALLWFETPADSPRILANNVDQPPVQYRYGVAGPYSHPFVVVGGQLWYLAEGGDLHHLDLQTREDEVVAQGVTFVAGSRWKDYVAWSQPRLQHLPPWNRTTILRHDTGETVVIPGALSDLDFEGFVLTAEENRAGIYDLQRRRLRQFGSPGEPVVIRVDGHGAFILARGVRSDFSDDVVFLDLESNLSVTLADHVGWHGIARPDPTSNGIVVFSSYDLYDGTEGAIRRFSSHGTEVVAEHVSPFFTIGTGNRILYEHFVGRESDGTLRLRQPDGTESVFAEVGWLVDVPLRYGPPNDGLFTHLPPVDLHGDILYSVASGPDTGLWRMPFQQEGS